MVQDFPSKISNYSAGQEINSNLKNPNVYRHVFKSPSLETILSQFHVIPAFQHVLILEHQFWYNTPTCLFESILVIVKNLFN
jgi:hypothetical protein